MNKEEGALAENLEIWFSKKPYWEQYIWSLNLEKETLSSNDFEQCYQYLCEYLGLIPPLPAKPAISFNAIKTGVENTPCAVRLAEVKSFKNVNALPDTCSIKFGPNLTLVYGSNGSGKSGVGRLLCNACFSRGERDILPNVKKPPVAGAVPSATFVLADESEIHYQLGEKYETLRRFSVFDGESVLIHLDESNNVSFTPAQVKVFDRVADTITDVENALRHATFARLKQNPFAMMFLVEGENSPVSEFCKSINFATKDEDFLKHASFDGKVDDQKIEDLQKQIDEKKKLDIPAKKTQLASDRQDLGALRDQLQTILALFAAEKVQQIEKLLTDISEKQKIINVSGAKTFDDGVLATVGSQQWKALITSAKILYDAEKAARDGKEPSHCMLCHQKLSEDASALFQRYWQFLQSKAEGELRQLYKQHEELLEEYRDARSTYPKFLDTDAGVKVLKQEKPDYITELKKQFASLAEVLSAWMTKIKKFENVARDDVPDINLKIITETIEAKTVAESKLVDPTGEIAKLTARLTTLKHQKAITAVKDAALEYLAYLRWKFKADSVSFAGIRISTTKKRTEVFLHGVAKKYKEVFNGELANLGCSFNLVMLTSGEQGNTVKEYRLDFAKEHNPSEILSQGEQNVCSLADFLTEVQLDAHNCGIIFDDPVTSLDHERKEKIAARLALEAKHRQVVILTHDIVFMSQLGKHAERNNIPIVSHWMKQLAGVPGYVEENTSPKLSSLGKSKNDAQDAVKNYAGLGAKEQERALAVACDYLRSACEASVEELLFAEALQRYDDQIRVQNLEEVVYDQASGLRIVDLHGRISEMLLAHNRSDLKRENLPNLDDFNKLFKEFEELEKGLKDSRKAAVKARAARREAKIKATGGW